MVFPEIMMKFGRLAQPAILPVQGDLFKARKQWSLEMADYLDFLR
jgi:hypothetical protein